MVQTDQNGHWTFESFPTEPLNTNILLTLEHENYAPYPYLMRSDEWTSQANGYFKQITLKKGNVFEGTVRDEAGKPVPGVTVIGIWNARSTLKTTTDARGHFQIHYLPNDSWSSVELLKTMGVIVRAPGKKTVLKTFDLKTDWDNPGIKTPPVEIALEPSDHSITIRVIDSDNKPLPGITINLMEWGKQSFISHEASRQILQECLESCQTDQNGLLIWRDAPNDELRFTPSETMVHYITPDFTIGSQSGGTLLPDPGGYITPRIQKTGEHEFQLTLYPRWEASGKVTDAETGEPISSFKVFQAFKRGSGDVYWRQSRFGFGQNGIYAANDDDDCEYFLLRIEATGYEPQVSPQIGGQSGKNENIDFALKRVGAETAKKIYTVLTPDGKPAANAYVSIATLNTKRRVPQVHNNKPIDQGMGFLSQNEKPYLCTTDTNGQFVFPEINFEAERKIYDEEETKYRFYGEENVGPPDDFALLILHDSGSRYMKQKTFETIEQGTISLEKFARLEGIVKNGTKSFPGQRVMVHPNLESNFREPCFMIHYDAISDDEGKFTIDNVIPSEELQINRIVNYGSESTNSHYVEGVKLFSGETTHVQIGGVGRPVTGKLTMPDGSTFQPNWTLCVVECRLKVTVDPIDMNTMLGIERQTIDMIPLEILAVKDTKKRDHLMTEWLQTEEGKKYTAVIAPIMKQQNERNRQTSENFRSVLACPVSADGTFFLDGVYPATWTLEAKLIGPRKEGQWTSEPIKTLKHDFTIDEIPGGISDVPLELGTLEFEW